jgi:methionine-rich copper-binding protein CopC
MSLRSRLVWLVLALTVPLLWISFAALHKTYASQQTANQERLQDAARALSIAVDREIGKAFVALDILSRSPLLADDNLETFHTRAQHLINWPNTWVAA